MLANPSRLPLRLWSVRGACLVGAICLVLSSGTGCAKKVSVQPERAGSPREAEVTFANEPQLSAADASKYLAVAVRQLKASGELDEASVSGAHFGTMLHSHRWILATPYDSVRSAVGTETRGYIAPVLDSQGSFVGAVVIEPWSKDTPVFTDMDTYRRLSSFDTQLRSALGPDTQVRFIEAPFGVRGFAVASGGGHVAFITDVDLSLEGVPGRPAPWGAEQGRLYKDQDAMDVLSRVARSYSAPGQSGPGASAPFGGLPAHKP